VDVGEAVQVVFDLAQQLGRCKVDFTNPNDNLKVTNWSQIVKLTHLLCFNLSKFYNKKSTILENVKI
jgi:hypothetical protein